MRFKKAYLEITNICNLSCSFCPGTKRTPEFMPAERFELLAGRLRPYTDYLYFHLMGEPLLHPELPTLLETAGRLGFKVIITTNGTLLSRTGSMLTESAAVNKINISLQSFEANDRTNFGEYIRSCCEFSQKALAAGKICVLRLWNNKGLDSLNPEILNILRTYYPEPWESFRTSLRLSGKVFLENGDKFDWPDLNAEDGGEHRFCYGLRDQIGVHCSGTVVPCCLDHDGDLALGNLLESTMEEILSSERAVRIYEGFSKHTAAEELCRKCGYSKRFG